MSVPFEMVLWWVISFWSWWFPRKKGLEMSPPSLPSLVCLPSFLGALLILHVFFVFISFVLLFFSLVFLSVGLSVLCLC